MMVAILSGLLLGVVVVIIVVPAFWSRRWSSERDFRRALAGEVQPFKKARFEPQENLEAFRKVWAQRLDQPLETRDTAAVRSVAPELAVFLDLQLGETVGNALKDLEAELNKGEDKWWASPEKAERERTRFIEKMKAKREDPTNKGECPSCFAIISLQADHCPKCEAQFGAQGAWRVMPLQ